LAPLRIGLAGVDAILITLAGSYLIAIVVVTTIPTIAPVIIAITPILIVVIAVAPVVAVAVAIPPVIPVAILVLRPPLGLNSRARNKPNADHEQQCRNDSPDLLTEIMCLHMQTSAETLAITMPIGHLRLWH
jgi:hypothetical protein